MEAVGGNCARCGADVEATQRWCPACGADQSPDQPVLPTPEARAAATLTAAWLTDNPQSAPVEVSWPIEFDAIYLGGHGTHLDVEARYRIRCGKEGIGAERGGYSSGANARWSYGDLRRLEVSGPGVVTSGGGFIGAGSGPIEMIEGKIVARILNSLTETTKVQTVVTLGAAASESVFLHGSETPEQLRMRLSPVVTRIQDARDTDAAAAQARDPVDRLDKLAAVVQRGLVTDDEFQEAKSKLLGGL